MKSLFLLIAIMSTSVLANDPSKACLAFSFDSGKSACLDVIRKGYMDEKAAMFCVEISFDSNKLACLSSSLDKTYTTGDVEVCRSFNFDSMKVDCMSKAGTDYIQTSATDDAFRTIIFHAKETKRLLYIGQYGQALINLDRIIEIANKFIL